MKKLLPLFFVAILIFGAFLFFRSNRPSGSPATVWEQPTDAKVDAAQLYQEFMQDETGANEKYLNKITEVSGEVKAVQEGQFGQVVLLKTNDPDHSVRCRLDAKPGESDSGLEIGQNVKFKCLCSGYVQDVEMVQCK